VTVFDDGSTEPRTHALLIGVGEYPHCVLRRGEPEPLGSLARELSASLDSPPRSAARISEWLLETRRDDDDAPLGSIELLTGEVTYAAVQAAFNRWYRRCHANPDNVTFFFFSGHGLRHGRQHALILSDVGENELKFFENAVDLEGTFRGMANCAAQTQLYFIDACRTTNPVLHAEVDAQPRSLITRAREDDPPREAPIFFAAEQSRLAHGRQDEITPFASAVMKALDGSAAVRRPPGRWEVRTDTLLYAINAMMAFDHRPGERHQRATVGGEHSGKALRAMRLPPMVPFRFETEPAEALFKAHMFLVEKNDRTLVAQQVPAGVPWVGSASPAPYLLHTNFRAGDEFTDATADLMLHPPCWTERLAVDKA
jgi:hypothetical protein